MVTTRTQREIDAARITKKSVADLLEYVPDECVYDIYLYVNFILDKYKIDAESKLKEKRKVNFFKYFGSMPNLGDGLELQKQMRDEWN